jgi:hypothetical protein
MSRNQLIASAAPLLVAWPAQASASDVIGMWGGPEASGVAVVGVLAALAWHQMATHRAGIAARWQHLHVAEHWHHVGDAMRDAIAYARSHAHLPHRR